MFKTINEIKQANKNAGKFWFSPDTLRFFKSKIHNKVYGGRFFITSEQYDYNAPRLYTIREASADGSIDTVGKFQEYQTLNQAIEAAKDL